jgi:NTE family protein
MKQLAKTLPGALVLLASTLLCVSAQSPLTTPAALSQSGSPSGSRASKQSSTPLGQHRDETSAGSVKPRPRIGVALGGGAALGLAHIGVLRYFEEHHIPMDYIAGTSMGGLVGGFYATGMSATVLEDRAREAPWDDLLSPNYRFLDEPIVEKQEWNRQPGWLTLRFGRHLNLPAGLNSGQRLALMLSRNTEPYSNLATFDELPTPFRCVATDLVSGSPIVLDHGSLPKALRSTMAIPGIFTPVNWEGKVLVDGGVTNNLPSNVVRGMGADKVIAVLVQVPNPSAKQFTSLAAVLRQSVSISIAQNERQGAAEADTVIRVVLKGVTSTDYEESRKIIKQGYDAAKAMAGELDGYSVSPDEWQRYLAERKARTRAQQFRGPLIQVNAAQPVIESNANHELRRKLGSGEFDQDHLEDVLSGVVAATGLPGAYYEWMRHTDGREGYRVEFLERPDHILLLRPAVAFNVSNEEPTRAALNLGTTWVPLSTYKSRVLGSFFLGYDPGVRGEYYVPYDGSAYFIAPGFTIQRLHNAVYTAADRTTFLRDRFATSFYAGIGTWRFVQFRFGARAGYDSYNQPVTFDGIRTDSTAFADPEGVFIYNTQDSVAIPSHGTRIDAAVGYSFREQPFPYFTGQFSSFHTWRKHVSLFARGSGGSGFGRNLGFFDRFTVGGQGTLDAYRYQEFHTNSFGAAGVGVMLRGPAIRSLSTSANLAVWHEVGRLDLGSSGWQTHQSSAVGLFFPTPVGALGATVAFKEDGRARFRLSLGSF